jgi:hypothetical protein
LRINQEGKEKLSHITLVTDVAVISIQKGLMSRKMMMQRGNKENEYL